MADPSAMDDLAKAGAGGGVVAVLASIGAFVVKHSTSHRLDALSQQMAQALADMSAKLTVLVAASERRDAEWHRLDAEKRFAALEAKVEALERRASK